MRTLTLVDVTPESVAAAKAAQLAERRSAAQEMAMLELERLVDTWGADQVQRWLDGAVAIRQDPRR